MWGVHSVITPDVHSLSEAVTLAVRTALAEHGSEIVVAAGVPFGHSGTTNTPRVAQVR